MPIPIEPVVVVARHIYDVEFPGSKTVRGLAGPSCSGSLPYQPACFQTNYPSMKKAYCEILYGKRLIHNRPLNDGVRAALHPSRRPTPDPSLDIICEKEEAIATELRAHCSRFGEETEDGLPGSTDALYRLGKLYLEKSARSEFVLQKLCMLRCCGLLHGARFRFRLLNDEDNLKKVEMSLFEFSNMVYDVCKVKCKEKSLTQISDDLLEDIKAARSDINSSLSDIIHIPDELSADELEQKKEVKFQQVKGIMQKATQTYKFLMVGVTRKCIDLLGPPPCRYAIAGLGSLARNEITLYSDFEHLLLLEDDIQYLESYCVVKEYFRWFTCIFQAIIIGLGETFIRSLGVPSICNFNMRDKELNWYYDVVTPCGIAFDGLAPHSCHNPLGRHESSPEYNHVIEFIDSAFTVAAYQQASEHKKNGYYVKDVLAKTCFVEGDEIVYRRFQNFSTFFREESYAKRSEHLKKQIEGNVNECIRGSMDSWKCKDAFFAVKNNAYRPLTALLAYLATLHQLKVCSTFEIIEELSILGVLKREFSLQVRDAFALTCEVRLKAYANSNNQRISMRWKDYLEIVGVKGAVEIQTVVSDLARFVREQVSVGASRVGETTRGKQPRDAEKEYSSIRYLGTMLERFYAGDLETAAKIGEELLDTIPSEFKNQRENLHYSLARIYFALITTTEYEKHFQNLRSHCDIVASTSKDLTKICDCFRLLTVACCDNGRYKRALRWAERWEEFRFQNKETSEDISMFYLHLKLIKQVYKCDAATHILGLKSERYKNTEIKLVLLLERVPVKLKEGKFGIAKQLVSRAAKMVVGNVRSRAHPETILTTIFALQRDMGCWMDSVSTIDCLLSFPQRFKARKDWKEEMLCENKINMLLLSGKHESARDSFMRLLKYHQRKERATFVKLLVLSSMTERREQPTRDEYGDWMLRYVQFCRLSDDSHTIHFSLTHAVIQKSEDGDVEVAYSRCALEEDNQLDQATSLFFPDSNQAPIRIVRKENGDCTENECREAIVTMNEISAALASGDNSIKKLDLDSMEKFADHGLISKRSFCHSLWSLINTYGGMKDRAIVMLMKSL